MTAAERTGEPRLGRAKNRDDRNAEERGEMHRAGVVREKQRAFAQLGGELLERGLADAIHAMRAECGFNRGTALLVRGCAEENPLDWPLLSDRKRDFGETLRQPALGGPVLGAWTKS